MELNPICNNTFHGNNLSNYKEFVEIVKKAKVCGRHIHQY